MQQSIRTFDGGIQMNLVAGRFVSSNKRDTNGRCSWRLDPNFCRCCDSFTTAMLQINRHVVDIASVHSNMSLHVVRGFVHGCCGLLRQRRMRLFFVSQQCL